MIPPASSLVSPWFTPPTTSIPYTPAPCHPAPTPSTPTVSCSPMNLCLTPVTGCRSGVPVTSVLPRQRSYSPTCVHTQPCLGWWTVNCCQATLRRFRRLPPATSTCPHPTAQVPCPAPSHSEALLVWAWHATTPTANHTWLEPQGFPCHPSPPPQHITPPMPSTVRDWAQPQPLATSDIRNGVDAHILQAPTFGLSTAALKMDSREWDHHQGVMPDGLPACQEYHLLASGL